MIPHRLTNAHRPVTTVDDLMDEDERRLEEREEDEWLESLAPEETEPPGPPENGDSDA